MLGYFFLESLIMLSFDLVKYIAQEHFSLILENSALLEFLNCLVELACNTISPRIGYVLEIGGNDSMHNLDISLSISDFK